MTDQEQELREAARVALLQWLDYLRTGKANDSGDMDKAEWWSFDDVLSHCYEMNHPHI